MVHCSGKPMEGKRGYIVKEETGTVLGTLGDSNTLLFISKPHVSTHISYTYTFPSDFFAALCLLKPTCPLPSLKTKVHKLTFISLTCKYK